MGRSGEEDFWTETRVRKLKSVSVRVMAFMPCACCLLAYHVELGFYRHGSDMLTFNNGPSRILSSNVGLPGSSQFMNPSNFRLSTTGVSSETMRIVVSIAYFI